MDAVFFQRKVRERVHLHSFATSEILLLKLFDVRFQEVRNGTVVWFLVSFALELFQNARFCEVGKRHEFIKKLELEV